MLRLADDWVWDSWIADDGERYHLFFLKAPRALGDLTAAGVETSESVIREAIGHKEVEARRQIIEASNI